MTPEQRAILEALKAQGWKWAGWFGRCVRAYHQGDECTKIIAPDGSVTAWS